MKGFRTAIVVGLVSAALTWIVVYSAIHEPTSGRTPDGFWFVTRCPPGDDDDLTALLWAAGAYLATFTPTLFILRGRAREDVFKRQNSTG
jgi:hypothetical protein